MLPSLYYRKKQKKRLPQISHNSNMRWMGIAPAVCFLKDKLALERHDWLLLWFIKLTIEQIWILKFDHTECYKLLACVQKKEGKWKVINLAIWSPRCFQNTMIGVALSRGSHRGNQKVVVSDCRLKCKARELKLKGRNGAFQICRTFWSFCFASFSLNMFYFLFPPQ